MASEHRVLVVDDEEVIAWAIAQALAREGVMKVETAHSGEKALEVMQQGPFDLVITDIRMEGMTGFELLTRIRGLYPDTGVVVMTAYGSAEAKREATERGSLFYLDKTFELEEFRGVVNKALAQVDRDRETKEETESDGFSGQIGNLNLIDMVQLNCLARNSGMLDVRAQKVGGRIGFMDGEIVYAVTTTGLEGRDAFIDMLAWNRGQFETLDALPDTQNIDDNWESLLIASSDVVDSSVDDTSASDVRELEEIEEEPTVNMHAVAEHLGGIPGVLGVFVVGDTGVLIDQELVAFHGDVREISLLAQQLKGIARARHMLDGGSTQNRIILQFERNRVVALEISDTGMYILVIASGGGALADLVRAVNDAERKLATLF
jgi:CheY-like chemotaxis protein